jgi:putative transposase
MKNTSQSVQEAIALRRMSLVQAVIELLQHHWPLSAALEQVSSTQPLSGDSEVPPQWVARRTLEDWYYAFKKGGFEGLKPKLRSDRGKPRRLSAFRPPSPALRPCLKSAQSHPVPSPS